MGIIVKSLRKAALAALMLFWIAPTANAVPVNYIVDEAVRNGGPLRDLFDELIIRGTVTVDDEDFDDFGPGQSGFAPIVDFELSLFLDLFFDDEIKPSVLRVTPDTATVTLNRQATRIDENAITIDASGLQPFTPLFDIQIDRFVDEAGLPTEIGFPDGRRLGDDVTDLLVLQFFSGSVNFGIAALTSGPAGPPSLVQTVELTPGNEFLLATAAGADTPVPAPPMLPLFAGALAFIAWRARRHPSANG